MCEYTWPSVTLPDLQQTKRSRTHITHFQTCRGSTADCWSHTHTFMHCVTLCRNWTEIKNKNIVDIETENINEDVSHHAESPCS